MIELKYIPTGNNTHDWKELPSDLLETGHEAEAVCKIVSAANSVVVGIFPSEYAYDYIGVNVPSKVFVNGIEYSA